MLPHTVIPAKAGIHTPAPQAGWLRQMPWIPAFAGMTENVNTP